MHNLLWFFHFMYTTAEDMKRKSKWNERAKDCVIHLVDLLASLAYCPMKNGLCSRTMEQNINIVYIAFSVAVQLFTL